MKEIELSRGYKAIVDDEDYEKVSSKRWRVVLDGKGLYLPRAQATFYSNGKDNNTYMHRFILGVTDRRVCVDHKNMNSLDNRRCNLRLCNRSQNGANRKYPRNNTSGAKGVYFNKKYKKFQSYISISGKRIHLGSFDNINDACKAYDSCARLHFGEFYFPSKPPTRIK